MRNVLIRNTYNDKALSESHKNNQGFYEEILQALESIFEDMTRRNRRVYFSMYGLRFPAGSISRYPNDNSLLSKFIEALMRQCKRKNCDAKYLWVRENSSTGQFHYHLVLLLDGNKVQDAKSIMLVATYLWQKCLDINNGFGLVHVSKIDDHERNYYAKGIKINKSDDHFQIVYDKCYQLASYLAKRYSKGGLPPYVKGFGSSMTRRDNSI